MFRFWMSVLVCASALTLTVTPARAEDTTEQIVKILADQEVNPPQGNLQDIPLFELLQYLAKNHGMTFVINEESFNAAGNPGIKDAKSKVASTRFAGMKLHQFLRVTLESMGATYLVRNNAIEIVSVHYAAQLTKTNVKPEVEGVSPQLTEPLVSFIVKDKPFSDAITKLAEAYDLNVVISSQIGEARTGLISARLLNMPAAQALELLALQADLRVVRKANGFFITSKKHAAEIAAEELEKEKQAAELKRLREPATLPTPKQPAKQPVLPTDIIPRQNIPTNPGM